MKGAKTFLLATAEGQAIHRLYLASLQRYQGFIWKRRPIKAGNEEYKQWNDWCAARFGALLANRDQAVEDALTRKRKEKRCHKLINRQRR